VKVLFSSQEFLFSVNVVTIFFLFDRERLSKGKFFWSLPSGSGEWRVGQPVMPKGLSTATETQGVIEEKGTNGVFLGMYRQMIVLRNRIDECA